MPPTLSPISLAAGQPTAIGVVVTANAVDPNTGANPGAPDTTTPLTFENVQGASGPGAAVIPSVDPNNNRRVIMTPGVLTPGSTSMAWSFRVKAAGRTSFLTVSGSTSAPPDVSGVTWDGVPPAAA